MGRTKLWMLRRLTALCLKGRVYYYWSRLWRWFFDRKPAADLPQCESVEELERVVGSLQWTKDDWGALLDAIRNPRVTWGRHLAGMKAGDCEDISLVGLKCMESMITRGLLSQFHIVGLLSVPWVDSGKVGGHNVGVFMYVHQYGIFYGHLSNWHNGQLRVGFSSVEQIKDEILGGRVSLGWAVASMDLKLKQWHPAED